MCVFLCFTNFWRIACAFALGFWANVLCSFVLKWVRPDDALVNITENNVLFSINGHLLLFSIHVNIMSIYWFCARKATGPK